MRKKTKFWLITGAALVLVGGILLGGVMDTMGWKFGKLATVPYETTRHELGEDFRNIEIVTGTADITLVPAATAGVVCHEAENMRHRVQVHDGTLIITVEDTRKWYDRIGIDFDTPQLTVELPGEDYGNVSIKTSTGDVTIPERFRFETLTVSGSTGDVESKASVTGALNIRVSTGHIRLEEMEAGSMALAVSTGRVQVSEVSCAGAVSLEVSTGKAEIRELACGSFRTEGGTGDILLQTVTAAERLCVTRTTGDVEFDRCDGGEVYVKTNTGDVTGSFLTEKIFLVQTGTGDVDVPNSVTGGRCQVSTSTGDVKLWTGEK